MCQSTFRAGIEKDEYVATSTRLYEGEVKHKACTVPARKDSRHPPKLPSIDH